MKEKRNARIAITFSLKRKLKIAAEKLSTEEKSVSIADLVDTVLSEYVRMDSP